MSEPRSNAGKSESAGCDPGLKVLLDAEPGIRLEQETAVAAVNYQPKVTASYRLNEPHLIKNTSAVEELDDLLDEFLLGRAYREQAEVRQRTMQTCSRPLPHCRQVAKRVTTEQRLYLLQLHAQTSFFGGIHRNPGMFGANERVN